MAWRRTGDKPLAEPMLIQFTDAYIYAVLGGGGGGGGGAWDELTHCPMGDVAVVSEHVMGECNLITSW